MLRISKDLEGLAVGAADGVIGHRKGFDLDDRTWVIRDLGWTERSFPSRSPRSKSGLAPTSTPISGHRDRTMLGYGGYGTPQAGVRAEAAGHVQDHRHLRRCNAARSCHIHASDGDIGRARGMLVDDQTGAVRYLVVHTSIGWLCQQAFVAPQRLKAVSRLDSSASRELMRQSVKDAPTCDSYREPESTRRSAPPRTLRTRRWLRERRRAPDREFESRPLHPGRPPCWQLSQRSRGSEIPRDTVRSRFLRC